MHTTTTMTTMTTTTMTMTTDRRRRTGRPSDPVLTKATQSLSGISISTHSRSGARRSSTENSSDSLHNLPQVFLPQVVFNPIGTQKAYL